MGKDDAPLQRDAEPAEPAGYERPTITSLGRFADLTRQSYPCLPI